MFNQPAPGSSGPEYYQKLRTKRVAEILRSQNMSNDDFVFIDNYIKTYFPEASKTLKNSLTQEALKKVFQGTQFKELEAGETVFTSQEAANVYVLIIEGNLEVIEENGANGTNSPLKTFNKGEVISPSDMQALGQLSKNLMGRCAGKAEILVYARELYDSVVKEFASAATNSKVKVVSKNFLKIKKMDRSSKEDFLNYFKLEKFTKGTVIISIKSRVEEVYAIQSGKVVLCVPNETIPSYPQSKIVIGVLGPESVFNEMPLILEKPSPYYAICLEDTEILSVGKTNIGFVTDMDTMSDLRANCQCKLRLQNAFVEKYEKMSKEDIEKSQNKIVEKAGIKMKDIQEVFEKFDPKNKTSHQFMKNLEKFNKSVEKPTDLKKFNVGPIQKFSEFATPRLVSKDPNFKNLDPQRQLALLALRNEGACRRAGNVVPQKNIKDMNKDDIMKMQNRLLNEEKSECEKLVQKKTISEKLNINAPEEEKEKDKDALESKKGLFNKMKMGNSQLLANFQLGIGEKVEKETPKEQEVKPAGTEVKASESLIGKSTAEIDELGFGAAQKKLTNLLGVNASPKIRPQSDIVNKKRTNLLKNANLL